MSDWQEHVSIFLSWNHLLKENQLRNLYLLQRVLFVNGEKKRGFYDTEHEKYFHAADPTTQG